MLKLETSVKWKKDMFGLTAYFATFFIIWSIHEIIINPYIHENWGFTYHLLFRRTLKILIWIVPVFLYLRFVDRTNAVKFMKADRFTTKSLKWTIVGVGIYALRSLAQLLFVLNATITMDLGIEAWTGAVMFAGITEEIVFRGFLLEKLKQSIGFWYSNIISSLLFVAIHFPVWSTRGLLIFPDVLFTMISVFLIGIFQGYIYYKGESIWPSAITHSFNNFIVLAIVSK